MRIKLPTKYKDTPHSTHAGAVFDYSVELCREFSYFDKYDEPYRNYKVINKNTDNVKVVLPRALFPVSDDDKRISGSDIKCKSKLTPRNDQQRCVLSKIDSIVNSGETGFIINASTGQGKTFYGCYLIDKIKTTTLVLIPKSDLEHQWRDSFKKFLGLEDKDIGLIRGDIYNVIGTKVCIGYVQSVMKDERYPSWVYKYFGCVIADEVHLMAANKFSNCMYLLPARYRLGLSATVDRSDNKHHVFSDHIGKTKIVSDSLPMPFDVVKVSTGVVIPKHIKYKAGRTMGLNSYLGTVLPRHKLIVSKAVKAFEAGRTIVCFSDTRDYLNIMYDVLIDSGVADKYIGFYVGGMKPEELKENAHRRIILATYKMCQYGTDYPHWDTAILMTPKADVRQIVGRVLREYENKKKPLVFDVVDNAKLLYAYWGARVKWYRTKADKIID